MRLAVVAGLIVSALTIVVIAMLLWARQSLLDGVLDARQAQSTVRSMARKPSSLSEISRLRRQVESAHSHFRLADSLLHPLEPALVRLSWVPRLGDQISVAPVVARVADRASEGTLALLQGVTPLVRSVSTPSTAHRPSLQTLLTQERKGTPDFSRACSLFKQAWVARRQIPGLGRTSSIRSGLRVLDSQLPPLRVECQALVLLPILLGADSPQTFLLAYQNADELRATGGYLGSFSLITLRNGAFSESFFSSKHRDNMSIPPPEPMSLYNREPAWLFRDSNWSPDFPTTAALERFFFNLDFHRYPANVVNITANTPAAILRATGPIYVPEYHRMVTANNVGPLADYYAHWTTDYGPSNKGSVDTQRKQFIGIVAAHILSRLNSISIRQWMKLAHEIGTLAEQGDILVNFANRDEEATAVALGVAGEVSKTTSDYLYVVDTNLSYNKINPYVRLQTSYAAMIRRTRWVDARLTMTFTNTPAPARLRNRGIGPGAGTLGGPDDYASFVRVLVPAGASLLDQTGWTQPWSSGVAYGKTMFCGYLIVPEGESRTVTIHYTMPPNIFEAARGTHYTLLVPHQPGSRPESLRVAVTDRARGASSSWRVTRPSKRWTGTMSIAPLPYHAIPLSRIPPTVVAPGNWIEPHAYLGQPTYSGS